MDKRVLDVIWAIAQQLDTPRPIVEAVIRHLRPSIRLVPRKGEAEAARIGGCRIGGLPDLPANAKWPRLSTARKGSAKQLGADLPLPFLMQINLAEVAPYDVEKVLPNEGMLYFFFHVDWGISEDGWAHFVERAPELKRVSAPRALPADDRYTGVALIPRLEWTAPAPHDIGLETAFVDEHIELWDTLDGLIPEAQGLVGHTTNLGPVHRLLGHPQLIQGFGIGEGARLLAQVDSDSPFRERGLPETGMMWGDLGTIYFYLTEEELKAGDFEAAFAVVENH